MKEPSRVGVINDFDGDVVNLYRVVANHLEEFGRQFKWVLVSRNMFEWAKEQAPWTLTDIQRAARFFYLQTCISVLGRKVERSGRVRLQAQS
jgi:DNA adenine methylase